MCFCSVFTYMKEDDVSHLLVCAVNRRHTCRQVCHKMKCTLLGCQVSSWKCAAKPPQQWHLIMKYGSSSKVTRISLLSTREWRFPDTQGKQQRELNKCTCDVTVWLCVHKCALTLSQGLSKQSLLSWRLSSSTCVIHECCLGITCVFVRKGECAHMWTCSLGYAKICPAVALELHWAALECGRYPLMNNTTCSWRGLQWAKPPCRKR